MITIAILRFMFEVAYISVVLIAFSPLFLLCFLWELVAPTKKCTSWEELCEAYYVDPVTEGEVCKHQEESQ